MLKREKAPPLLAPQLQRKAQSIEELRAQQQLFMQNRLEPATQKSYDSSRRAYDAFRATYGETELPEEDPNTLSLFMMARTIEGMAQSTILKDMRSLQAILPKLRSDPQLMRQTVMAVKKQAAEAGAERLPISSQLLSRILQRIPQVESGLQKTRSAVFFAMLFRGCMRAADLIEAQWQHLQQTKEGLILFLPYTKADPFGEGSFARVTDPSGAILTALNEIRKEQTKGGSEVTHIFAKTPSKRNPQVDEPVAVNTMRFSLKRAMQGLVPDDDLQHYGLHSFRRGAATELFKQGASIRDIMIHGRWKSNAVLKYVVQSSQALWKTAELLQGQKPGPTAGNQVPADFGEHPIDNEPCQICGKIFWTEDNHLLICDGHDCGHMFHMRCLVPPLTKVPDGTWVGPCCGHKKKSNTKTR